MQTPRYDSSPKRLVVAVAAIFTSLALLGGCARDGNGVEGRASRDVRTFSKLDVGGTFKVAVVVGPEASVEVVADENLLDYIETKVNGDTLKVRTRERLDPELALSVRVTVPSLEEVDISGVADIRITGLHGPKFELDASGASDIHLEGQVDALELDVSGVGDVEAFGLQARSVDIDLSGAAKAEVTATEKLVASISGSGRVRYAGSPASVEREVSGAGSIEAR